MQNSTGHQAAGIDTSKISVASFTVEVTQPPFPCWDAVGGGFVKVANRCAGDAVGLESQMLAFSTLSEIAGLVVPHLLAFLPWV